jgi:predicted Zn-dependent peptidase
MNRLVARGALLVAAQAMAGFSPASSQSAPAFDRTTAPRLARPARLTVPVASAATLTNGVSLRAVQQRELPLVQITAVIRGGARLDEKSPGMATFMAGMLDEGAGTRDAAALQSEIAYLGASLSTRADWDAFHISLKVPVRSLAPALDLMADVVVRPTFSGAEVRRQRDLRLANLLQLRDQPNALAGLAFNQIVFPSGHPYHSPIGGDSLSTVALDSAAVRQFYAKTFRPERTTFYIVGDISLSQARALIGARFGAWRASGAPALEAQIGVEPRMQVSTQVYLVDKPEAAQSVITIGWPGVNRASPDYAPLMVMNTLLGGSFTSRLNMNLRETKGYSYGAGSSFTFRRAPGPFTASAAVRTNVTDSALVEFFRELNRIRGERAAPEELERAKAYLELGLPGALESTAQIAGQLADLATFGLTLDELPRFAAAVRAVSAADVQRVAQRYLTPQQATVVVVGDLAQVRAPIDALRLGVSTVLDVKEVAR